MVQIKGFAIRGLLRYIKESGYSGGIPALLEKLPPKSLGGFDKPILASHWYPYDQFIALLETVDRELSPGAGSFLEALGFFAGDKDAGSVFRIVAVFASITRLIQYSPKFWTNYCDAGSFEVTDVGDHRFDFALNDFPDIAAAHCTLITGWVAGLGQAAGADNLRVVHTRCVSRGDERCEFEARWG